MTAGAVRPQLRLRPRTAGYRGRTLSDISTNYAMHTMPSGISSVSKHRRRFRRNKNGRGRGKRTLVASRLNKRATELSKKIQARINKRDGRIAKCEAAHRVCCRIQAELEEVLRRQQAAAADLRALQDEITGLDQEIENIKAEKAEVMRLAAQEAQVTPGMPRGGGVEPEGNAPTNVSRAQDIKMELLRLAMMCPDVLGVSGLLQAAVNAGVALPGAGAPSGPVTLKRSAAATPPRGEDSEMEVAYEGEWHDPAWQGPEAGSSKAAQMEAQRLAEQGAMAIHREPNAVERIAFGGNALALSPTPAVSVPPRHDSGPGVRGARCRRAQSGPYGTRGDQQRRSQEAIAVFSSNYRMQLAHEAAAASVIQDVAHGEPAAGADGSRQTPPLHQAPEAMCNLGGAGIVETAANDDGRKGSYGADPVVGRQDAAAAPPAEAATWEDIGNDGYHTSSEEASAANGMECG